MRRVDSFTSDSNVATENVLATHSRPGCERGSLQHGCGPLAPGEIDAGGGERRGDGPLVLDAVAGEPRRERLLAVGAGQRIRVRRHGLDLTAQRVERGELRGRDLVVGEPAEGRQQRLDSGLESVDRSGRGGCRIVDLVREAGGERAEGDE